MFKKHLVLLSTAALIMFQYSAFSQEKEIGTEVVNIVKPYSPTISDAFKVKEIPVMNDSINTDKKEVEYTIFSVPVASTFTPSKGKATEVEKTRREKFYNSYATLGFGNYTSVLGELYTNFELSRTENAGFYLRHNSAQGDIKGVILDNKYYDTRLDANFSSRQKNTTYRMEAGAEHQLYNWYGTPDGSYTNEMLGTIDPQQNYFSGYVGGSVALSNSFFERGTVNFRYLGDSFSSSEFNIKMKPEFSFPLESIQLKIDGDVDYLNGSFNRNYKNTSQINYSFLNAGLAPSIAFTNEDLSISIGVAAYILMDTEKSESDFSLYPRLNASYRLMDETVIVYGGVEGGVQQNSYYDFKEENPFISPTLNIAPTKKVYEGFGGVKGKLSNNLAYNFKASYGKEDNKALFQANPLQIFRPGLKGYDYGNSFNVVYDNINTLDIFGELEIALSDMLSLGVNVNYYNYGMDTQNEAWNLPNIKASLFSNFNITEKLYGGVSMFFVGERKDLEYAYPDIFGTSFANEVKLDSFFDANVHFGYRITDRLSAFIKGSNFLGNNYQKWVNYPVQGIQGLVGATYKFDW